ncbi:MAG: hypothetical protein IJO85_01225 [Lachnospiraceae bacterium]|nr:hypothetical protein [Lachnospiraceae bacterium]
MTEGYLQILIESLEKKNQVLDKIIELNKVQAEISSHQPMDMQAYDKSMDDKGELIDEINRLDDGFTSTYELIKNAVQAEPTKYRKQVLVLQELIRKAVDKGMAIEAQEKRNRAALETVFRMKRQEIKQMKVSNTAAVKYYKAMSKINTVDPQLMDRKK